MIRLNGGAPLSSILFTIWTILGIQLPALAQENDKVQKAIALVNEVQLSHSLPSLSVAVSKGGEVIFSRAEGFSDLEMAVPASIETKYRVGSISKSITAVLTLILMQKEFINLDLPIQDYCPDFPKKKYSLNLRQLLTHQAGIRHYDFDNIEEEYYSTTRYNTSSESLLIFKNDTLISKPGDKYHYSSYGYSLIGCAIENVTQSSFQQALTDYIFKPTGMNNTLLDYPEYIIRNRAKPYDLSENGEITNSRSVDLSNKFPGGGILSTPSDLVQFGNSLLHNKLLTAENMDVLWTEQKTSKGESTYYALGWRTSKDKNYVYHGGSSAGGKSLILIIPQDDLVVAFATNASKFPISRLEFAQQLATLFSNSK
ncbi:MAG: serine hydrolase domain-containing protein [Bacteroidota bacterium]